MKSSNIIVLAAALLLTVFAIFVSAEEFGQTYPVSTPSDTLNYMLSSSESLAVKIDSATTFDITLSNITSTVAPPSGYEVAYAFKAQVSATPAHTLTLTYTYDEISEELFVMALTKFAALVNNAWVALGGTLDIDAKTVTFSAQSSVIYTGDLKEATFAILNKAQTADSSTATESSTHTSTSNPVVTSSNGGDLSDVVASSASHNFSALINVAIVLIAAALCL